MCLVSTLDMWHVHCLFRSQWPHSATPACGEMLRNNFFYRYLEKQKTTQIFVRDSTLVSPQMLLIFGSTPPPPAPASIRTARFYAGWDYGDIPTGELRVERRKQLIHVDGFSFKVAHPWPQPAIEANTTTAHLSATHQPPCTGAC